MPGPGFVLQDFNDRPSRKPWVVTFIVVCVVTVGIILAVRHVGLKAISERIGEKPETEAVQPSAPATTPSTAEPAQGKAPTAPSTTAKAPAATHAPAATVATQTTAKPALEPTTAAPAQAAPAPLPSTTPSATMPQSVLQKLEFARKAAADNNLAKAREICLATLEGETDASNAAEIEKFLGDIDINLIFTPSEMPGKIDHSIASGESLRSIANKYGTTIDLLVKGNNVANPNRIQIGDRLRVLDNQKFEIVVSKGNNTLLVKLNGKFFKRYNVGTGKFNRTPNGTFVIDDKIVNPPWWRPDGREIPFGDKENILGTRWMRLKATGDTPPARGYGIHGTWDESSLGKQSSAGCVRMANKDVEELYTYAPLGTVVTIVD